MLQNFFYIFVLCVFIELQYCLLQENEATLAEMSDTVPTKNYTFYFYKCAHFPKLNGVTCQDYGFLFPQLEFYNFKHLSAGMFDGFHISLISLKDPSITIDEKCLKGMLFLEFFEVHQSSIKVTYYLFIFNLIIELLSLLL